MKFPAVERTLVNSQFGGVTLHVSQSNAGRLPHDIAQLTREHESTITRHGRCFHEEDVTAGSGYRQTGCNARSRSAGRCLVIDLLPAQCIPHRCAVDGDGWLALA